MNILDTTIRDGSYAVDFQFSCKDVRDLVARSEKIGIRYIEIGHGMGLNASSAEHGIALHTDLEYMEAARQARLGFFCIPGIARLKDLETAKENGMGFIRVGVDACEYEKALPYVKEACSIGMEVFINFMKTYTIEPEQFAAYAGAAYDMGVKAAYIVDSAGCMEAGEIGRYIDAVRAEKKIALGFHGHDNLGLAVSNTVYCVERGIEFIDCSFQGLGRSMGNASMEQVAMVLDKKGYETGFDIPKVLEYGYAGLKDISSEKLTNPLDYMCGYAGFHSGFMKYIYQCCGQKTVDPLRLMLLYSRISRNRLDYDELCRVADAMPKDLDDNPYHFGRYFAEKHIS